MKLSRHIGSRIAAHGFEFLLAVFFILGGLPILITQKLPASVLQADLPFWLTDCWAGGLVLGGAFTAVGLLLPRRGEHLEKAGLGLMWFGGWLYAFALIGVPHHGGLLSAAIYFGFGLACWGRIAALGLTSRTGG